MNNQPKKKQSLYSKFKDWCELKKIPPLLFPIIILIIIVGILALIYAKLKGIDIGKALTSKGALLVYLVAGIVGIAALGMWYFQKEKY